MPDPAARRPRDVDPSLISLVPTGSVAGVLVVVVIYLLRQNHQDRTQYRADVARIEKRSVEDITALHAQHASEMAEVKKELVSLRESNESVIAELDLERHRRWTAEDAAAGYRRELQEIRGNNA